MRTPRLTSALLACATALSCSRAAAPEDEPAPSGTAGGEHESTPIRVVAPAAPSRPPEPASEEPGLAATAEEPGPATPGRADVYVNGARLGEPDLRELEVRVERRPEPGKYWYDAKSGLWGLIGHGASGLTAPRLRA
ncbi:MAG: hypothetical protein ACHQ53_12330, partial [Polyangiales bacterium]